MKDSKSRNQHPYSRILIAGVVLALIATCSSVTATIFYAKRYASLQKDYDTLKNGYKVRLFQPNETVMTDNFSLSVTEVKTDTEGIPDHLPVPEGYKFLTLTLSVKNMTASEQLFLPENHLYLRDANGMKYDITATKDVEQSVAGPIVSGDTIIGQVGFLVPNIATSCRMYFTPYGSDSADVAVIDISSLL